MRHDLTDNTANTINIRRGKRLPVTATVFQRGQVLLNRKGISEKKNCDFGCRFFRPDLLCDTRKEFRGSQRFSVGENRSKGRKMERRGRGTSRALQRGSLIKVSCQRENPIAKDFLSRCRFWCWGRTHGLTHALHVLSTKLRS